MAAVPAQVLRCYHRVGFRPCLVGYRGGGDLRGEGEHRGHDPVRVGVVALAVGATTDVQVKRQVATNTQMTIEGIWRLNQGRIGCGKGAPRGSAWYLDVQRIISPNPLYSIFGGVINVIDAVPTLLEGSGLPCSLVPSDA